ncbi:hypothetical protein QS987_19810, partial [Escherichia coli]|nr:hypothetical protein [Escherichia coli]
FHTIVSIKNDGHYFCRAGGNRPDGLNEPVTYLNTRRPDKMRQHRIRQKKRAWCHHPARFS